MPKIEEFFIELSSMRYACKRWGDPQSPAIFALHGWLDNVDSFVHLAPACVEALDMQFIAVDFAGHGLSSHRHEQGQYQIWSDLKDLKILLEHLDLQRCVLLGHSRGAMIATLLATTFPEVCRAFIALDGLLPLPIDVTQTVEQLRKHLIKTLKKPSQQVQYTTFEQALVARCKAANMLTETALPIVKRALLQEADGRWRWRSDARVMHPSAFKFTREHNHSILQHLTVPTLLMLATKGLSGYQALFSDDMTSCKTLQSVELEATHHLHLERDKLQQILAHIKVFLDAL